MTPTMREDVCLEVSPNPLPTKACVAPYLTLFAHSPTLPSISRTCPYPDPPAATSSSASRQPPSATLTSPPSPRFRQIQLPNRDRLRRHLGRRAGRLGRGSLRRRRQRHHRRRALAGVVPDLRLLQAFRYAVLQEDDPPGLHGPGLLRRVRTCRCFDCRCRAADRRGVEAVGDRRCAGVLCGDNGLGRLRAYRGAYRGNEHAREALRGLFCN